MFFINKKFIIFGFITSIMFFTFIYQYPNYQREQKEKQILQSLNLKAIKIDIWIKKKKKLLEKLSLALNKVSFNKEEYLKLMNKTNKEMETHSIFSGFVNGLYFDTQGYWINNFDPRNRPWYKETFKNKKTTVSGPMYYNDISGQKISWWAISSILLKDKKFFGVISSEILPDMIIKHLENFLENEEVINVFLFHKNTGVIISSIDRGFEFNYVEDIFSKELFNLLIKTDNQKIEFKEQNNSKVAFITKLKEVPWVLCAIKELK